MKIWLMLDICANFWGFWVNYIFLNILVSFTFLQNYENNKNKNKMLKKSAKSKKLPRNGFKVLRYVYFSGFYGKKKNLRRHPKISLSLCGITPILVSDKYIFKSVSINYEWQDDRLLHLKDGHRMHSRIVREDPKIENFETNVFSWLFP